MELNYQLTRTKFSKNEISKFVTRTNI